MLKPLIQYVERAKRLFIDTWCDDKYKYYCSSWNGTLEAAENDWEVRELVSIDKYGEVIGFIHYKIDRQSYFAYDFAIVNFTDNITFGVDVLKAIKDIFTKYNFNKLRFNVVCGNPVEIKYDKLIHKYGGRIIGVRKNEVKLSDGKVYDEKMYEILKEDYLKAKSGEGAKRQELRFYGLTTLKSSINKLPVVKINIEADVTKKESVDTMSFDTDHLKDHINYLRHYIDSMKAENDELKDKLNKVVRLAKKEFYE